MSASLPDGPHPSWDRLLLCPYCCRTYYLSVPHLCPVTFSSLAVQPPFPCPWCSEKFRTQEGLYRHCLRHLPHCPLCGVVVARGQEVTHLQTHEAHYLCERCGQGFTTSSALWNHRNNTFDCRVEPHLRSRPEYKGLREEWEQRSPHRDREP